MQFRVIVVTDPQTQPQTHRQDRLQYTVPQLARSVKVILKLKWRKYQYFKMFSEFNVIVYHV